MTTAPFLPNSIRSAPSAGALSRCLPQAIFMRTSRMNSSSRVEVGVEVEVEKQQESEQLQTDEGRWTILVHNDDVTPYDFVILVLRHIFSLSTEIAEHVTWQAHINGVAPVCSRSKPEAERLINEAHAAARANGYPLTFTIDHKE